MSLYLSRAACISAALAIVGLAGGPLRAETLPVEGLYAAADDNVAEIRAIAIDPLAGGDADRLALAIEQALRTASIDGQPWFGVALAGGFGDAAVPDAVLSVFANTQVGESRAEPKKIKRCAERDAAKKCIRETVDVYRCRNLTVSFDPEARLISLAGERLYAASDEMSRTEHFCEDESEPSVDAMIDDMAGKFARKVRLDLAPEFRREGQRVLEGRKGIAKADRNAFKNAVRLTKNDPFGACAAFADLEAGNPRDISVLFNIGLCRESEGDLDGALAYYGRVLEIAPRQAHAEAGAARIASRRRADDQVARHFGT